jgi:type VI secretion system ImpB/VipA family protein
LTYDTRQPDQPRIEKELPFRLLVLGDLTGRGWKTDAAPATADANATPAKPDDLEHRPIHNLNGKNLADIMSKMNISLTLNDLENLIDPDGKPFSMTIPIRSMESFEPGQIVNLIGPVQKLLEIRKLVLELQGLVSNNKKFVRLVRELMLPANRKVLEELQQAFAKSDSTLKVPAKDAASAAPAATAAPAAAAATAAPAAPAGA